jgi:DNA-binding beta-propeller fold protein YncE
MDAMQTHREEGREMATIGTGKYTFQLIENWAKLPAGETFGNVSAVTTDSQDRVYVFQRKDPPVMIFDRNGTYLSCWGISAITDPHGIYIADDVVYLTDRADSVCLTYTLDGKPLQLLGRRGQHSDTGCEKPGDVAPRAAGPFNYPTEMVPAPSGDLYVSDGYRNARVHRFTADGRLLKSWGEPGKGGPNQFHLPHSLVIDQDGTIYVCDRENNRIQVFSADGEFRTMWTDMRRPLDISIGRDGLLYISEGSVNGLSARISIMDTQGQVVARWDSLSAHGSWVDAHGDIYLALGTRARVDKYVRQG